MGVENSELNIGQIGLMINSQFQILTRGEQRLFNDFGEGMNRV
jgi:hypothetical protein